MKFLFNFACFLNVLLRLPEHKQYGAGKPTFWQINLWFTSGDLDLV